MCIPTPIITVTTRDCPYRRRVRFSLPEDHADDSLHLQEQEEANQQWQLTRRERKSLWYNKRDLNEFRLEFKRTLSTIRRHESCINHLMYFVSSLQHQDDHKDNTVCVRGCERYYSWEHPARIRRGHLKSVLQAQEQTQTELHLQLHTHQYDQYDQAAVCLRKVSELVSCSSKEKAAGYANLNAVECWGAPEASSGVLPRTPKEETRKQVVVSMVPVTALPGNRIGNMI
jgi:hypothetical protein